MNQAADAKPYIFSGMSDSEDTLGQRIEHLRAMLGSVTRPLSLADFARLLSEKIGRSPPISASTIQRWERDDVPPDAFALAAMAALAHVTMEEFLYGSVAAPLSEPLLPADAPEREAQTKRRGKAS